MSSSIPIFIPSKGRHSNGLTWKALDSMGVDRYRVIVEPQEYDLYRRVLPESKLLALDMSYKRQYDTCDGVPYEENPRTGSGAARNFGWDVAKKEGAPYHWIVDDNIRRFMVYNSNQKYVAKYDTFACVERFVDHYSNVTMAGMQYAMFVPRRKKQHPLIINTRIFSCNLIKTDSPFRWRGRYNEDVILSLDMLEAGCCTMLFHTYMCEKIATQRMKGGNTSEIYGQGTEEKSRLLKMVYPRQVELVMRYGRHHHQIDFSRYRGNLLKKKITTNFGA
ncbi:MAG: hypothetical protein LBJ57_05885 [Prevotellaceae bacterium]|jgi:hypothetical protein|nr:hypothetical protein [Prevotellaceae bacterium]